jgi:hypothetical protein
MLQREQKTLNEKQAAAEEIRLKLRELEASGGND